MSGLVLHCLGPPNIEQDGKPVHVERRKAVALLVYLAVTQRPHSREALAALLWPDLSERQARTMLRHALTASRSKFQVNQPQKRNRAAYSTGNRRLRFLHENPS